MKLLRIVVISISLVLLGMGTDSVSAENITLATTDWQPYAGENLPNYGFTSEIIATAFERRGYTVQFTFLPWKRAMIYVESGRYDALYSAYYSEERAQIFALSEPYTESIVTLCSQTGRDITYTTFRDLIPYRIGVVRGYVNSPEFDAADYLHKDDVTRDIQNIYKLLNGRLDLIVVDKYVAIHHIKTNPTIQATVNDVTFLEPPLDTKPVYIMFSKAVPGYEKTLADFNAGLKAIQDDGTYQEILHKYGFLIE